MTDEQLACELYSTYESIRSGCDKEVHADVWQYMNPFQQVAWLNTAKEMRKLLTPSKPKKAVTPEPEA
ncbi:hypothetical protein CLI64_11020 [Nostoc sp. CENA543]|uniref:hypothetical protein n=1 Tax=Nostoc sp. CENA543 TaxID=1869241 RepID=UPI000CA1885E|nr:hypothetical protein [Nostoc sp. CENA543]AUT00885.1 hypothetical protein CLI64_11020 [Nostoc sp. CENA543]